MIRLESSADALDGVSHGDRLLRSSATQSQGCQSATTDLALRRPASHACSIVSFRGSRVAIRLSAQVLFAVVNQHVELHESTIDATSRRGEACTLIVRLPLADQRCERAVAQSSVIYADALRRFRAIAAGAMRCTSPTRPRYSRVAMSQAETSTCHRSRP